MLPKKRARRFGMRLGNACTNFGHSKTHRKLSVHSARRAQKSLICIHFEFVGPRFSFLISDVILLYSWVVFGLDSKALLEQGSFFRVKNRKVMLRCQSDWRCLFVVFVDSGGKIGVLGCLRGLRRVVRVRVVSFMATTGVISKNGTNLGTVLVTIASEKYCNSLTGEALELESSLSSYVSCFP